MAAALCAVCGDRSFEIVDRQDLKLVGVEDCALRFGVCAACGHIQQCPPIAPHVMEQYYASFSNYTAFDSAAQARAAPPIWCTRRLLSMARDLGVTPGRVYEVGCAHGKHLHHFRAQGWQVSGCDLSPKSAAQAGALFEIPVDIGPEAVCVPAQSSLDLVLIVHVLEHLYEPAAALRRIHGALGDEGHLILEVPGALSPERLPPGWFAFEHLHYFTPDTLERLLDSTGFSLAEQRITYDEVLGPVILLAARKRKAGAPRPQFGTPDARSFARAYVARDRALWAQAQSKLAAANGEAFIWGAGVHTAQLLDRTSLRRRLHIPAMIDRDPQKWGKTMDGVPVMSPEALFAGPSRAPIIVSSYFAQAEIVRSLLSAGIEPGRILRLYGDENTLRRAPD